MLGPMHRLNCSRDCIETYVGASIHRLLFHMFYQAESKRVKLEILIYDIFTGFYKDYKTLKILPILESHDLLVNYS